MDTNPVAEVADPEDRFAALFGEKPEAPVKEEPAPVPEAEAAPEGSEADADETAVTDQAEPEAVAEEAEEVEYEGKVYALPKELKEAVLRQKDYTLKTQQVAEQRRELEAAKEQLQQVEQFRDKQFAAAVALSGLDSQLKQYQAINWSDLAASDPVEFMRLDRAQRQLQEQFNAQKQGLQEALHQEKQLTAQQRQEQRAKLVEQVVREVPGYDEHMDKALLKTAIEKLGAPRNVSELISEAWMVKTLHAAHKWLQLQEAKPALQKRIAEVKPITVKTSRTAQPNQADIKSQDVRARLKKTGSTKDAEDAFALMFAKKYK